jgi:hypothetical protein
LINKAGSKHVEEKMNGYHIEQTKFEQVLLEDDDCEACKL